MGILLFFVICILNVSNLFSTVSSSDNNSTDEFGDSYFGILVSPLIYMSKSREIEIYWNHEKYHKGDKIGLYNVKPNHQLKPIFTFEVNNPSGIVKTEIEADFIESKYLGFTKQCLKFHIAWLRNGTIVKENCLKTEPTWMEDMKCFLGYQNIRDIFIPGTHNSVSYQKPHSLIQNMFYNRFVITQDEDILGQLIYGARYLDIRVCYRPSNKIKWWGCHEIFKTAPLQRIIDDVKIFLNNTNEIVIFDVQEFSSEFREDPNLHDEFVKFLKTQFEEYITPYYGWYKTMNDFWNEKKRLIIGYDHSSTALKHKILWPRVTHQWGNVQSIDNLYKYLNKVEEESLSYRPSIPRSTMAELTPTTQYILKNILGGLRQIAEEVNPKVTTWYNEKWHNTANIVSVDFIKDSGIVDVALKWNSKKFKSSC